MVGNKSLLRLKVDLWKAVCIEIKSYSEKITINLG